MDDIHSHWKSYLHEYGVLANAPYSQFHSREGWDVVYMWESLEEHEPTLANTYGKKVAKPSLMVVVAPTTEIGDDYFLNKLHKAVCIKPVSVYYGAKRCPGRGVVCRWSFAPTAECYLRTLLPAAPTSGGTWDSHLHAEPVGSSEWRLPRSFKIILANARRR